ncbi:MAG: cobalamin-independent methionine synthase II family protein [Xanthobacteraceae bacterium]
MPKSQDRILTTHVGSLVRPPELSRYIEAIDNGVKVDQAAFDRCLADSVADVVKRQQQAGIDVVSDGEFGKFRSWSFYVLDRLGGIEERAVEAARGAGRDQLMFPDFYAEYFPTQKLPKRGTTVCVGPITYKGQAAVQKDIAVFKAGLKGAAVADAFLPVVAPASAVPRHKNEYYKDDEEFLFKLAEALREEYQAIVDAGLMVQIDDAFLPYMYDVAFAASELEQYRKWAAVRIEALNHAIAGLPEERIRYHICWGSFNTPHVTDVPLRDIVDLVLRVKAGAYCIEMGNPRHEHEWRVWESVKLPAGRKLIPGVISHATNVVEHPDDAAGAAGRAGERVGRHRLRLCPDAPRAARSPLDHVGQIGGACRGRAAGVAGLVGQEAA